MKEKKITTYELNDTTPYSKLKSNFLVFEVKTEEDLIHAAQDNVRGNIYIEDTKAYTINEKDICYVLFYDDDTRLKKLLKGE